MTGFEALERCRNYDREISKLHLRLSFAHDAAMRITPSLSGAASGGGAPDKIGAYIETSDKLRRQIRARRRMYEMEMSEAARLAEQLDPAQGRVMYLRMIRLLSIRQICEETHASEGSVRGLLRRARERLESMKSPLDENSEYLALMAIYEGREGLFS